MSAVFVIVDFTSFWMHAMGAGGGADVDLVAEKHEGFPVLRGRHVRGVLREASRRVEAWSTTWETSARIWDKAPQEIDLTQLLFGTRTETEGGRSIPGCLDIRDFHIPENAMSSSADSLADPSLAHLYFSRIAATAIDPRSGAAKDKTLRAMEVGVPLPVGGWITWAPQERRVQSPQDAEIVAAAAAGEPAIWRKHLERCLIEARAFGANRTRGYGRGRFDAATHVLEVRP